MLDCNEIYDTVFDTFKKLLYPEEWIDLDQTLSKSELFTLLQVERNGEIIMSQIADYINISMSTATGIVERLVKQGFIERNRNDSDRRIVTIKLTAEGKALAKNIKSKIFGVAKLLLDSLTEEEQELLFRIFTKVTSVFSTINLSEVEEKGSVVKKIEIE
jgi:MarR family transcriptional regulator, organic hydroperoxide resistance regulator